MRPALRPPALDRHPALRPAARLLLAAALVLLVLVESLTLTRNPTEPRAALLTAGTVTCLCAVPWPRPSLTARAWTAAGVSWAATLYVFAGGRPLAVWGLGEAVALLVLLTGVLLRLPARRAAVLGPLLALACAAAPVRDAAPGRFTLLFSALAAVVSAFSLLLRGTEAQRVRDMEAARAAERLDLARELHDLVAHHVTGIVVQARAASYTAGTAGTAGTAAPATADTFTRIADAGDAALGAMRRLVRVLREGEARTAPLPGLAELRALARPGAVAGPPVTVEVEHGLEERLPADLAATAHHIVREALTNVRKHAADATAVRVTVRLAEGGLEVRVTDDGAPAPSPGPGDRGGFGLVGLAERVRALGGHLAAGPRPGGGWEVRAVLPYGQGDPA
ncbi:Nitrate/nitrite sensor protein NarX [Streptomyces sp. YIM 121038]|uniref:sensor histidine kinase n=1 Tax=Streptomyces sp. YIM 121038 TaxID=2136401 RepID=UPI0011102415|nr:histidine kinase [Streptomyces sp. YIM 121038]QCX75950.1 Nitrate/nitrite sensor protein NarX [Streptomyces sp. YIM 121038]